MRGRRHKFALNHATAGARGAYLRVAAIVADATGVPFGDIVKKTGPGTMRRAPVRFARQATLYLTVTKLDVRMASLARAIGRPRVRILWACRAAEDSRDDRDIDQLFERIEAML